MDGLLGEVVRGLLPTVGVSLLFGGAIWAIVRADASERADRARIEAEEDAAARGAGPAADAPRVQETDGASGAGAAEEADARDN